MSIYINKELSNGLFYYFLGNSEKDNSILLSVSKDADRAKANAVKILMNVFSQFTEYENEEKDHRTKPYLLLQINTLRRINKTLEEQASQKGTGVGAVEKLRGLIWEQVSNTSEREVFMDRENTELRENLKRSVFNESIYKKEIIILKRKIKRLDKNKTTIDSPEYRRIRNSYV